MTHRNFSPDSGLRWRSLLVSAENSLGVHDKDAVRGEAVDLVLRAFPCRRFLAQKDVPRRVESRRKNLDAAAVALR